MAEQHPTHQGVTLMYNKVDLTGNVGTFADYKVYNNRPKLSFSMATTENWTDANGQPQQRTDWHNCVAWGPVANRLALVLRVGTRLSVTGSLRQNTVMNHKDPKTGAITDRKFTDVDIAQFNCLTAETEIDKMPLPDNITDQVLQQAFQAAQQWQNNNPRQYSSSPSNNTNRPKASQSYHTQLREAQQAQQQGTQQAQQPQTNWTEQPQPQQPNPRRTSLAWKTTPPGRTSPRTRTPVSSRNPPPASTATPTPRTRPTSCRRSPSRRLPIHPPR